MIATVRPRLAVPGIVLLLVAACTGSAPTAAPPPVASLGGPGTALAALDKLPVKDRLPMTGYTRAAFGPRWADVDHNGCDTRNDVLRRDLTSISLQAGTRACVVASGRLADPYTGQSLRYALGSAEVSVDHVVPIGDAWQKGAQDWTAAVRTSFANDPLNLLAVSGPTNQLKGSGDAATWLPPNRAFRCSYVARQIAVKVRYGGWVTEPEHAAMARVLRTCPAQVLPIPGQIPVVMG